MALPLCAGSVYGMHQPAMAMEDEMSTMPIHGPELVAVAAHDATATAMEAAVHAMNAIQQEDYQSTYP
mgnify:CR=1 FL=1